MGNDQQNQGMWDKAAGSVKEGVGDLTDNDRMQYEGKIQQGEGHVREGVGDLQEGLDRVGDDLKRDDQR
jgi:uncharacterized protein YjbJ (UPF0337 family)